MSCHRRGKDTRSKRAALLATQRGHWVDLDRDDAARLLALNLSGTVAPAG
jgi:hypothetical protein